MRGILAVMAAAVLSACGSYGYRDVDTVGYAVERVDGPYEIRSYEEIPVATAYEPHQSFDVATQRALRRVSDYFEGANEGDRPILRYGLPILHRPQGVAVTAERAVIETAYAAGWELLVPLPAERALAGQPEAEDPMVRLGAIPAQRVAVVSFPGPAKARDAAEAQEALAKWLRWQGEAPAGDWFLAEYDTKETLTFLRLNEVWIPLR